MSNGIEITQEGVGVDQASDYQKVLDSRWLSMEIMHEVDIEVEIPSIVATVQTDQIIRVFRHGLTRNGQAFVPAYHANWAPIKGTVIDGIYSFQTNLFCDDEGFYFYRTVFAGETAPTWNVAIKAKIYNIPILEAYQAPVEINVGGARSDSIYGVQALDGSNPSLVLGGKASYGYSIDTKKKILSVNKVTTKYINDPAVTNKSSTVTAIDIATNTFTYTPSVDGDWIVDGLKVIYSAPTYPAPLVYGQFYILKNGVNTFQLSYTYGGPAIDITTTGALPGGICRVTLPEDYGVPHGGAYPPSFFFCEFDNTTFAKMVAYPLKNSSMSPLILADSTYLYFRGVQSVYIAKIAVIILKDPLEILA